MAEEELEAPHQEALAELVEQQAWAEWEWEVPVELEEARGRFLCLDLERFQELAG